MPMVVAAVEGLRRGLESCSAEASLYHKQYDALCSGIDGMQRQHKQASSAARAKVRSALKCQVQDSVLLPSCSCGHVAAELLL